jgi:hypothetical protein
VSSFSSASRRVGLLASLLALAFILVSATVNASAAQTQYRGVMLHSLWGDSTDADMDHELDMASAAGSNVVRVDVAWSSLETGGKGALSQWYVDKLDRFVAGAQSRGMKVLADLWSTPCWASSAPDSLKQNCDGSWWDRGVQLYAPTDPTDFGNIAKWVTSRYGSKLAALEVWNEPNNPSGQFWKTTNGDLPGAYAGLVKATYPLAKAGDPNVPVIVGSLSGTDRTFLRSLYADGIKGSEDGIAVHPYNDSRGFGGLTALHGDMVAQGDNNPVYVTEFGWPTGSDSQWHVSDTDQSTDIRNGYADLGQLPWVALASLYNLRDKGTDPSDMEQNFGVVRRDYSPKPAYAALTDALNGKPALTPISGSSSQAGASATAKIASDRKGSASDSSNPGDEGKTNATDLAINKKLKLRVALSAPGKRSLTASGQLVGVPKGIVTLTALRATPSGRYIRFATKTIKVKRGRFKANLSRYKKGRYQLKAALRGTKVATTTRKHGLAGDEGNGPAATGLPPGVVVDGTQGDAATSGAAQGTVVQSSTGFGSPVAPGPLRSGGLLRLGSDSNLVRVIKDRLTAAGFKTSPGKRYDASTQAAVRSFQSAQGLLVDGIVGRQTMASLLSYPPLRATSAGYFVTAAWTSSSFAASAGRSRSSASSSSSPERRSRTSVRVVSTVPSVPLTSSRVVSTLESLPSTLVSVPSTLTSVSSTRLRTGSTEASVRSTRLRRSPAGLGIRRGTAPAG